MKLLKRNIHMNKVVELVSTQLTVDDDFIVPDIKPDVDRIISKTSEARVDTVGVNNGRITIRGALDFRVLYGCAEEGSADNMKGSIVFEEQVNCDSIDDYIPDMDAGLGEAGVQVNCMIENIQIGIINTRKISVKAILQLSVTKDEIYDIETGINVESENRVSVLTVDKRIAQVAVSKKDILRIKDEIDLGGNKPNIGSIVWDCVKLGEVNYRPVNGAISVSGEVKIFIIYKPVEEELAFQWIEGVIPFSGTVQADNCTEDMIPDIRGVLSDVVLDIRNDYDGEPRIIAIDGVLKLNILMYQEEDIEYLADVYCCGKELEPVYEENVFNRILIKNTTKAKVSGKLGPDSSGVNILQVCCSDGVVSTNHMEIVDNGIKVTGFVIANILYISDDDRYPFAGATGKIPFEHIIEVPQISKNTKYHISTGPLTLSAAMSGAAEVEIKGNIVFECLALEEETEKIITDIEEYPLNMEKVLGIPGMVGYMVKNGDTLWNIAKEYYTTVESIKEINGLKSDSIKAGDMLLIVKRIDSI